MSHYPGYIDAILEKCRELDGAKCRKCGSETGDGSDICWSCVEDSVWLEYCESEESEESE